MKKSILQNNPQGSMRKKAEFGGYYLLSALAFSVFLAFHLMTDSDEFIKIIMNNYNYFISPVFFIKTLLLLAGVFALILWFSRAFKAKQDEKKDRIILLSMAVLLPTDFIMAYFKYYDATWMAVYNSILAVAFFVLCLRMKTFENEADEGKDKRLLYFLAAAAAAMTMFGIIRAFSFHDYFFTFAKDLGVVANDIWRTGDTGSQFTYLDGYRDQRGAHFQPVIYLFALLFRVYCSPYALLFLQVVFSFFAVFFLYLLSDRLLENKKASFLLSLAFLVSAYTARTFVYDYHFDSMYMAVFFAFLYFAESRKFFASVVMLCLAVSIKEEAAIYMTMASLFVFLRGKDKRYLAVSACAFIYAVTVIRYVIPAYNYYNNTFAEQMLQNLADGFTKHLSADMPVQLGVFFLSAAFLPFLAPAALFLLLLPPAGIHSFMYDVKAFYLFDIQYASFVTPALFAAVVYGLKKAGTGAGALSRNIVTLAFFVFLLQAQIHLAYMPSVTTAYKAASYAITVALLFAIFLHGAIKTKLKFFIFAALAVFVFYSGYFSYYESRSSLVSGSNRDSINTAIKLIPEGKDRAVVTNTNIATHLCCRKYIFAIELSTPEEIFRYLRKDGVPEFYLLVYLQDFTYNGKIPQAWIERIFSLAKKTGYRPERLYNDGITVLVRFLR